jgi:para-aminobenzoate synthetase / 4-amino-4-deoxychorismate lyase
MHGICYALLDDAGTADPDNRRSRLYSGHAATLACADLAGWRGLLRQMQRALDDGLYAVLLCDYELDSLIAGMPLRAARAPLARALIFDTCRLMTQAEVAAWLAAGEGTGASADVDAAHIAGVVASVDEPAFRAAVERIRAYIAAGDAYQVNYTYRLRFDAHGPPRALYRRLRARQPVPYGALIQLEDGEAILSLSPELFVRHHRGELTARPMKGTAAAAPDGDVAEDLRRGKALADDGKNRAENLMIVDLLRNDLGRIAMTGSVEVPALFEVRRYGGVLQMTSTVRARLRHDTPLESIFAALYPCGSITGAPKRRSMEIIGELEPDRRGLYTGAIGWFDPAPGQAGLGDFCLSVPIRTVLLQPPQAGVRRGEMGVGAGIVHDSDAGAEYAECRLKAAFLTALER